MASDGGSNHDVSLPKYAGVMAFMDDGLASHFTKFQGHKTTTLTYGQWPPFFVTTLLASNISI